MQVITGIGVSPGVAICEALVLDHQGGPSTLRRITPAEVPSEIQRLQAALDASARELESSRAVISVQLGPQFAAIFEAHGLMVRDPQLRLQIEHQISNQGWAAENAVHRVLRQQAKKFQDLQDQYLAERAQDIFDIEQRLLRHLSGVGREMLELQRPVLVLSHNLTPSETVNLNRQFVRGMATELGGQGSHTAIVAHALGIPAVVGLGPFLSSVSSGEQVILDGGHGRLILQPDADTLKHYQHEVEEHRRLNVRLQEERQLPAETADGHRIQLFANIEFPHEATPELARDSDGIGLYRTEFLYLGADHIPTVEDHYQAYKQVLQAMGQRPVVIRTLDLGADKLAELMPRGVHEQEQNPFLGLRSIRLSLRNLALFRTQLRAILRASLHGQARVMFPLVSTVSELRQAKRVWADIRADMEERGEPFDPNVEMGIMVEVPSTALLIEHFVSEVDFFSIGTNDLIQYTLAVDRGNKEVANLYSNSDPAVLRLISRVIDAAQARQMSVSVCGQMCSQPIYIMLLLGMGLRSLSVPPNTIAEIKKVCRSVKMDHCREVAHRALSLETASEVTRFLRSQLLEILPELIL